MGPPRYFDKGVKEAKQSAESSGPKVQEKKEGSTVAAKNATLFVSSLPFSATSTDLSTLFSDIGPLRKAFVVTDKETGKSKGVGYVTFAIAEDAERAFGEMQGKSLDGGKRKMRIEWSTSVKEKERYSKVQSSGARAAPTARAEAPGLNIYDAEKDEPAASAVRPNHPTTSRDPDAIRTLVLTGLAKCQPKADSKTLYKKARKIGDVENVIYPAPAFESTRTNDDVAHIVYRTANHAMTAVTKLHAHVFKGAQLSAVLKKRLDGAARLEAHMRPETKAKREAIQQKIAEEASQRAALQQQRSIKGQDVNQSSRLIIRNLPFDITDADLRAVFLPYGPIYSVDVPQKPVEVKQSQPEETPSAEDEDEDESSDEGSEDDDDDESKDSEDGKEENDSEEDSEGDSEDEEDEEMEDGTKDTESSESSVEEDMETEENDTGAEKSQVEASPRSVTKGQGRGFAFVWLVSRADASRAIAGVNGKEIGRGAAERAQYKAAKGKGGREAAKKALEEVTKSAQAPRTVAVDWALSKKDWEKKAEETDGEETEKEAETEEEDEKSESENDDEEDEEEATKPALPEPEEGTTLFIRNLPYQATEIELRDLFRSFGPLRYAKVTMDRATKRPKGTGFVCFWQKESADKALRQANLVEQEAGLKASGSSSSMATGKQNPFSQPSVLTADPSAPLAAQLNLHGRLLSIVPAVARPEASALETNARKLREKGDKRNTYLMREGVPLPGTALASQLSEQEREKRLASFSMRKSQLQSNPGLYISKTRLSVRQLPLYATQKTLKRLALYATREFDAEVKRGEREDLSAEDKAESNRLLEELKASGTMGSKTSKKVNERPTAVIQSKVVRQNDTRLDPLTGQGRSRGYAFLEMRTFADALKVVRWANASKEASKLMQKFWIDELESMVKGMKGSLTGDNALQGEERVETEARLKRVEKRHAELKAGAKVEASERGGLMLVEFSIENITITRKRKERAENHRDRARRSKEGALETETAARPLKRGRDDFANGDEAGRRKSTKAPRRENWNQATRPKAAAAAAKPPTPKSEQDTHEKASGSAKLGSKLGSMIGRKRKERKQRT